MNGNMQQQGYGSPAHAGIDPLQPRYSVMIYRFPRTRGDRPFKIDRNEYATTVPPHTRG